jgi:aspartyl-tRNA(Asn)/glutamyl-tRNA(Gln) amidotransferase subunit A
MESDSKNKDLSFLPAYKLAELIRLKKLSPVELMEVTLRKIDETNPVLNAYLTVDTDKAMHSAHLAEKAVNTNANLGPLHGIPISIKDLVSTKDIRTTMGSMVYNDFVPGQEGTLIQRLKSAGAIIVGKTNTPEFGLCCSTENKLGDACRNPWNTQRTSGGSSGGAAASVAVGITPIAQGSDGGGSTRIPSSFCGVFGLKGTYGRVPKDIQPWGVSNVSCLDPIARCVKDAALMLNVMAGSDGLDYSCIRTAPPDFLKALDNRLEKLKIAWSPDLGFGVTVDQEVMASVGAAVRVFEQMGHDIEEAAPAISEPFDLWDVLVSSRSYIPYGFVLDEHADEIMDYTRLAMECARNLSVVEVSTAWLQLERLRGAVKDFFEKYDLLVTPTTAVPAFPVGQRGRGRGRGFIDWDFIPFTCVFNLSGNPAASVPCGFSTDGLPIGLQIVGRLEDEATVLAASAAFEEAQPWSGKYPPI